MPTGGSEAASESEGVQPSLLSSEQVRGQLGEAAWLGSR